MTVLEQEQGEPHSIHRILETMIRIKELKNRGSSKFHTGILCKNYETSQIIKCNYVDDETMVSKSQHSLHIDSFELITRN